MQKDLVQQIIQLQTLFGDDIIICFGWMHDDLVPILYQCLRQIKKKGRLGLVLLTKGGRITTAHRVATLFREYSEMITCFIPYQARSAGTLLALGMDELVCTPLSEFTPMDVHLNSTGVQSPELPGMLSAEDIRSFHQMAKEWFGIERTEDRIQLLAIVSQRIFPVSLSSFFRADKLVRSLATQLLSSKRTSSDTIERLVDRLVGEYFAHDYSITREELRDIGLPVRDATPAEEELLWAIYQIFMTPSSDDTTIGLVASTTFFARLVGGWKPVPSSTVGHTVRPTPPGEGQQVNIMNTRWMIEE